MSDVVIKYSWGERFVNWLMNSKTLRQKMGKRERLMTCIQLDRMVFDDVSPFLEKLKDEALQEGYAEAIADVVAWLRATDARMDAQKARGAVPIHYMHEIGQRSAAKHIADAVERGDAKGAAKKAGDNG